MRTKTNLTLGLVVTGLLIIFSASGADWPFSVNN